MSTHAPTFTKLLVADPDRSVAFYQALGFVVAHRDPVFVRLRWPSGAELVLVRLPAGRTLDGRRGGGVIVCFRVDEIGVEVVAEQARAQGAATEGPTDQPWHTREVGITDPDGYRLTFLQSAWPIGD